jgi:hypothetical protein
MEDISEKHVLFSPLWGRFPALDWEEGFSDLRDSRMPEGYHHVLNEPRRKLGKGLARSSCQGEKMIVAGRHDKGLTELIFCRPGAAEQYS